MTVVALEHIVLDEAGVAWIAGTGTKVVEVVLDKTAYGMTPEEIGSQHRHLSLAQVYAALSHYYDHQTAMDAEIRRREKHAEALRRRIGEFRLPRVRAVARRH